ncbi:hypothetical protein ACHAXS_010680, partial [Conticribra weissflogii]
MYGQIQGSKGANNDLTNASVDNLSNSASERGQWAPIPEDPHPNLQLNLGKKEIHQPEQLPSVDEQGHGQLKSQQLQRQNQPDVPSDSSGPSSSSASSSASGRLMLAPTTPSSTMATMNPSYMQTNNDHINGNNNGNNNRNNINFRSTHDYYNRHSNNYDLHTRNSSIISPQHSQLSRQPHSILTPHSQNTNFSGSMVNNSDNNQNYPQDNGGDSPTKNVSSNNDNNDNNNTQLPALLQPDAIYVEHYGDAYVDELIKYLYPTGYQSMRPRSGPWKLSIFIFLLFLWLSVFIVGHCYDRGQREYNYYFGNDDDAYLEEVDDDTLVMETRWCGSKMLYFMWMLSVSITILAMSYCSIIGYVKVRDVAVANGRSLFPGMENTV